MDGRDSFLRSFRFHLSTMVVLLLLLSQGLIACSGGQKTAPPEQKAAQPQPAQEKVIKFGTSVPLTGGLAKEGKLTEQGYKLWADYVNERGGIKVGNQSYKISLITYDDKSDAQTAAKLTERLITEDKVDFLLSPYSSGLVQSTSSIAEKYKKINIAPTANVPSIYKRGYKYVFSLLAPAAELSGALHMVKDYNIPMKTLVILTPDDLYPLANAEQAKATAEELGFNILWFAKYPKGISDFSSILSQVQSYKPDAIFASGFFEESVLLVRQMNQLGVKAKMVALAGPVGVPDFIPTLGSAAENIIGHVEWMPTLKFSGPVFGSASDYAKLFESKYGFKPSYHAAAASAAGLVLQLAIEKAGSIDTDAVLQAMHSLDVETFFSKVKFGKIRDIENVNVAQVAIPVQVQKGKLVVLYPESIKEDNLIYPMP